MTKELNQPSDLTLWPTAVRAKMAECSEQPTLRAALRIAVEAIESGTATPWIITSAGDILAPNWIAANGRRLLAGAIVEDEVPIAA